MSRTTLLHSPYAKTLKPPLMTCQAGSPTVTNIPDGGGGNVWVGSMETLYLQLNFAVNIKLLSQTRWFTALRTNTITGSFFSAVCTPTSSGGPRAQREASRCTLRSKAREARVGPPPPPQETAQRTNGL